MYIAGSVPSKSITSWGRTGLGPKPGLRARDTLFSDEDSVQGWVRSSL